jgi:hypothetical protein
LTTYIQHSPQDNSPPRQLAIQRLARHRHQPLGQPTPDGASWPIQ